MGVAEDCLKAKDALKKLIVEGQEVYYVLREINDDHTVRLISATIVNNHGKLFNISNLLADLLGFPYDDRGAVEIRITGMDVGVYISALLSHMLFGYFDGLKTVWV